MAEWIEFGEPDDTGLWVECPECHKQIRNLRMAKGAHAAWHLKQRDASVGSAPQEGTPHG